MEQRTLLVADNTGELVSAVAKAMEDTFLVLSCRNGSQALELLRRHRPEILVVDLLLPEMDGLTLLTAARAEGLCPQVLVTCSLPTPYVFEALARLEVNYVMIRPCMADALETHIREMAGHLPPSQPQLREEEAIRRHLLSLNVNPRHQGFGYLLGSIHLRAESPDAQITKEIYPAVARRFGVTPGQVERCIRTAILRAWSCRNREEWLRFFPRGLQGDVPRPTNAAFIAAVASVLHRQGQSAPVGKTG